jgi:hypothetical protein
VSTKTPSTKAKKPATKPPKPPKAKGDAADEDKKKRAKKPGGARDEEDGDGDEDEDDEDEFVPQKKSGKPAAEPTAVVPARRLTPEAKAAINAMVAKGVPLDEALRRAGSWETFVAPVKDETQKGNFPGGKEGGGPRSPFGGRRPSGPRGDKSEMPREPASFDEEDSSGFSLGDDEPIVAGGDDD